MALCVGTPAEAQRNPRANEVIRTDPAVRQGRLPNGLRYALMRNDRPVGGLSIRLRFDVGSYEEPDEYRGIAHFLEHMAFNGTRGIPEGELVRRFAEAGVAFGRDQNASTSMFATTYDLELPRSDAASLDLAFGWLRDIGDGLTLTPEAVAREQGVIIAEHNGRLGPARDWYEAYQAFAAPDARSRVRSPIGTSETIRAIDAGALTAFHRAWYRPDNAILVIAGDLPVNQMEARVRRAFGDWRAPSEPMVRAEATPLDPARPLDVLVYPENHLTSTVGLCRLSPWQTLGPDTRERRRHYITRGLWAGILNRRLQLLSQGADAPFAGASVSISPWTREANAVCLNVTPPVDGDWRAATAAALTEVRRMEAHGVSDPEIKRLVDLQKRSNSTSIRRADDRYSSSLVQGLLGLFPVHGLDPSGFVRPRDIPAIYNGVVAGIDAAAVQADFVSAWNGSEPLIAVRMPEPPTADEVRAVWAEAMAAPAPEPRPADEELAGWAYEDFGPAGEIVSRETIAEPGFTRVTFANGVVLNVKSVQFTRSQINVSVEMGGGRNAVPDADFQTASMGAGLVWSGGLGQHSLREIQDLFPTRRIGVGVRMQNDTFQMFSTVAPAEFELQLQAMTALLTDPGFRDDFPGQRRQMIDTVYRNVRTSPANVLTLAVGEALAPGNPRLLPPREQMDALTMADIERIYRPILTETPIEVTIVGDLSEERMIEKAAATFGALPPRTLVSPDAGSYLIRYGDARPQVQATHEGAADQAMFTATWPLFVGDASRRREQRALELVRGVLQNRIRDEVRETLGATYSPGVGTRFEDGGDDGSLSVSVATSPADIERVREAVRRVVAEVAAGQITQAELDNVRGPILARIPETRATNSWWYGVLNGSVREPQKLRDAVEWESDYRAMTLDELKAAAAQWLSGEPIEGVALPQPAS
ncbi:insulinase family protein [Brevundimonas kwangchunensis]|uniref:Insulinase family protein n=2 Tax=Brevundimonas kwangchunensis TaxID=322163 RepID=A0ABP3RRE5_9CAUL